MTRLVTGLSNLRPTSEREPREELWWFEQFIGESNTVIQTFFGPVLPAGSIITAIHLHGRNDTPNNETKMVSRFLLAKTFPNSIAELALEEQIIEFDPAKIDEGLFVQGPEIHLEFELRKVIRADFLQIMVWTRMESDPKMSGFVGVRYILP